MEGDPGKSIPLIQVLYFNPLPPHGGRPEALSPLGEKFGISIHSLRMEGDPSSASVNFLSMSFQSTPSAWRETCNKCSTGSRWGNFNPLPPHGGRPGIDNNHSTRAIISIHSLRMEGDRTGGVSTIVEKLFQSTPSAWRETAKKQKARQRRCISIHSLRMEGDLLSSRAFRQLSHFNPLPPHGGRPLLDAGVPENIVFQSTPSAWRETPLIILPSVM